MRYQFFNINGQLIKQFSQNIFEAESPILIKIPFNLGSDTKLQKGIYPYKVEATTEKTNKTAFGTGKLIVID